MFAPHRRPAKGRGTALFVHGLWLTGAESFFLKRQLAREGWALRVFPYSSLGEPLDSVARRCARHAHVLALRTLAPVHLIGHSLGGLVICRMFELGLLAPDRFSGDFCRVVLLGSPVNGSQSGRALSQITRKLLGRGGEVLARDLPAEAARRRWSHCAQVGLIAGNRPHGLGRFIAHIAEPNDGTVAVSETRMEGVAAHCVLPVSHTGMLVSDDVARQLVTFLDQGRFDSATR